MRAAVLERAGMPLEIKEVPEPAIGPQDVLVRVHACGVCHTDLHLIDGLLTTIGPSPFPLIPGHEIAGVVEKVGDEVAHLNPGDRAGVYWWLSCGCCPCCLAGQEEVCLQAMATMRAIGITRNGGYAEYVAVPAAYVFPIPEGLDYADAAPLYCAGLTVYGAFKNAGLHSAHRVAILGVGGLGHLGLQIANAMGAEVIAITSSEAKQDLARQLGAHHVVHASGHDIGTRLSDFGGADVIVSTTLDFQAIREAMRGLAPLGTLVIAGMAAGRLPIDPRTFILSQQRVIGSYLGSRRDLQELLQLAARFQIRPMLETFPLEEVNLVHQYLRDNKIRFRGVLIPNEATV
ncbi:MAG: alcohol dehydrogenase catalytic domain-containing protein [Pirellulales bacterium]|nr:alcohol dehydrogenase catalytic domain-containing protein [Pirellulales bacterium]